MRFAFMGDVVLSPDKRGCPVRVRPERSIIYERCRGAVLLQIRLEPFRALDVAVRNLQGQVRRRVPGNAAAIGIEARLIEIVPLFVRLASAEQVPQGQWIDADEWLAGKVKI